MEQLNNNKVIKGVKEYAAQKGVVLNTTIVPSVPPIAVIPTVVQRKCSNAHHNR
jgi:hypothetical protein